MFPKKFQFLWTRWLSTKPMFSTHAWQSYKCEMGQWGHGLCDANLLDLALKSILFALKKDGSSHHGSQQAGANTREWSSIPFLKVVMKRGSLVNVHSLCHKAPKDMNPLAYNISMPFCLRMCSGMSLWSSSGVAPFNSEGLKLNRGGSGRPLGNRAAGLRSSSKNGCTQASRAVHLKLGEYWSRRDIRSTASGGVRFEKILCQGCAFICGNL